jgi:GNAT superfamily N-acetyltransferase
MADRSPGWEERPDTQQLGWIYAVPEARGRGFWKHLVQAAIAQARAEHLCDLAK